VLQKLLATRDATLAFEIYLKYYGIRFTLQVLLCGFRAQGVASLRKLLAGSSRSSQPEHQKSAEILACANGLQNK
jgi:hypothetical protein